MNDSEILREEQTEEVVPDKDESTEETVIEETTEETTVEPAIEVPENDETASADDAQEEKAENSLTDEKDTVKKYSDNYYLLYGNKEKNYLDLDGTIQLLQALGFDGGELKQAREGKETFQTYKENTSDNPNQLFCSYCGLEISGVEYQRLPDGRLRCTACSNTLVKSEMQELCDRVKTNMEAFFGAAINVPIHIEVLEERKLKKKIKSPLSVVDDKSILVLGAAVNDKKGYKIYLENGAPRISVIATFAHELTHIWQYINWDNKKGFKVCPRNKRLLIYEGMAKWVEIQYLYLIGETAVARREEFITRNRDDEYGMGFRMLEDKYPLSYGTIVCDNAPFTKDTYPID